VVLTTIIVTWIPAGHHLTSFLHLGGEDDDAQGVFLYSHHPEVNGGDIFCVHRSLQT
jgi:hypothetical protein